MSLATERGLSSMLSLYRKLSFQLSETMQRTTVPRARLIDVRI